jgi:hypothetical protein
LRTNKGRKQLLTITLAATVLAASMTLSLPAERAAAAAAITKLKINEQPFSIEGTRTSIATINKNNSTYIAIRSLNNNIGLKTTYEKSTKVVRMEGRGRTLELGLSNHSTMLNGQLIFGPEPILQDNTTYLPLRFLLEQMGYDVSYEQATKLIGIHAIQENALKINAEVIGADGDGKSLNVYYPVLSGYANATVQQKINTFLKAEADRNIAAGIEQMNPEVEANRIILAKNPKAEIRQPYFDGRYQVTYNEQGRLSLYVDYHIYLGGAHGVTARVPYTFDLATGNVLSLKDVVEGNEKYVSIINNQINKQIKSRNVSINTPFETIEADRDYFLNRNGVVIYFTQYEYTSFAEGMPEFVIPYSEFH